MRHLFTILLLSIFCSCEQKTKQPDITPTSIRPDSIANPAAPTPAASKEVVPASRKLSDIEWQQYQDSLRNELLKTKEHTIVKESLLQELYIRDVATVTNDSVFITIPFNLHGLDCGAPDGYSTDVSFSFKLSDPLLFPQTVVFREHEHGMVEKETNLAGNFQLIEQNAKHVIYHSPQYKRTLVLFAKPESGTFAFYFTGVGKNRINGTNVYHIMDDYSEEKKNSIYPFTSTVLKTGLYEHFLRSVADKQ
jgi:hypothetical protein